MVEHLTFNQRAAGSTPAGLTIYASPSSSLAKDTALSRRRPGFKSPWGRHPSLLIATRIAGFRSFRLRSSTIRNSEPVPDACISGTVVRRAQIGIPCPVCVVHGRKPGPRPVDSSGYRERVCIHRLLEHIGPEGGGVPPPASPGTATTSRRCGHFCRKERVSTGEFVTRLGENLRCPAHPEVQPEGVFRVRVDVFIRPAIRVDVIFPEVEAVLEFL